MILIKQSFTKSSSVYIIGDLLTKGINFLLIPFYALFLNETEYGILSICVSITAFLNILFSLGFGGVVTRLFYECKSDNEKKELIGTASFFLLFFSIFLVLLIDTVCKRYFPNNVFGISYLEYGRLALFTSALSIIGVIPQAVFKIQNKPTKSVSYNLSQLFVTLVLTYFLVARLHLGVRGALIALLLSNIAIGAAYLSNLISLSTITINPKILRGILLLAWPLIPHLISHWALSLSDRIILGQYVSIDKVGVYSFGYQLGSIVFVIANAINSAWVPYYYRERSTREEISDLRKNGRNIFFIINLVAVATFCYLPFFVDILLDKSYGGYSGIVGWIAIAGTYHMYYLIFVSQTFFTKKIKLIPIITIFSCLLNVGLNLFLIPRFGIISAALSTFLAYLVLAIANGVLAIQKSHTNIGIGYMVYYSLVSIVIFGIYQHYLSQGTHYLCLFLPLAWVVISITPFVIVKMIGKKSHDFNSLSNK